MIALCWALALGSTAQAAEGRVIKVLPQFLDKKGLQSVTPSLYDRDAYQAYLRRNPSKCSALRFAVQWKAKVPETETLRLRVEIHGMALTDLPRNAVLEIPVHKRHWYGQWAYVTLSEDEYKKFGEVTAWRVTLWDGNQQLGEAKSFLW